MSDDGRFGLSIIAFVGSVFSPYYARARGRGDADPRNHCAINVALYGPRGSGWSMTERGRARLDAAPHRLAIGPSSLAWDGAALTIRFDEVSVPWPKRLSGRVRLVPAALTDEIVTLNSQGGHGWWPIAPVARVEVALDRPGLNWSGHGYFDSNWGAEPIEAGFRHWSWARAALKDGAAILYDGLRKDGSDFAFGLRFDRAGRAVPLEVPPRATLGATGWRIPRSVRSEEPQAARLVRTLEDTPFYARSLVETTMAGERVVAMHESLSVARFDTRLVKLMLPFRMPRRA